MPRILVTPYLINNKPGRYRDVLEAAGCEIVYPSVPETALFGAELTRALDGVTGILAGAEPYPREVLAASGVRAIARAGVGYDSIDMATANERGIAVTITPGTNEHSVAEQAIALVFGVYREVARRDAEVRAGQWLRRPLWRLAGKTFGVVGLGRIGRAVVPRAKGLGLRVVGYDPFADRDFAQQQGIDLVSFDELLAQSDIVSLHVPVTAETRDLINRESLARMKRGAVLINTSRGGLVDEEALAEALAGGQLAGAGLDVFKIEPLPQTSPLVKLNNVVLSPHMGGLDEESAEAMVTMAAECLAKLIHGAWPAGCVVNEQYCQNWKW